MITVFGIAEGEPISPALRERVEAAQLIAGGARQLALFPEGGGERFVVGNNIPELVARLQRAIGANEVAVVLASGDPLLYGIGATLRRYFTAEQLEIIPAVSSVQRAFAAVGEPWHDALLLSAHGRPVESVIAALAPVRRAAILTDAVNTPALIARRLSEINGDGLAAVCERLGTPEQRIVRGPLSEIAQQEFDPMNVMVLLPTGGQEAFSSHSAFGLPDDALEHDGLITHLEVRAVSMAYLRLKPASIVWDIGAGSGSVAIEAARLAHRGMVYAVERDPTRYERLCRNVKAHGAGRVRAAQGEAPAACASWPLPDAVFVGGSGERIADIVSHVAQCLRSEGRVVINLVTLDRVNETIALLRDHGFHVNVIQVSVARSRPLQDGLYLAALNPVWILAAGKD